MTESNNKNSITHFAVTNYRNIKKRFGIKEKDRSSHMYMIGKTGVGKSTLIENMVISDIKDGHGVALIDPHGDLAENILNFVPESRIKDIIYFNPADIEYPIAFNPIEDVHLDYHHLVSSSLISVLKKVWPEFWGPRLEHILRNSIMALLENPTSTLLDMPKLLTDKEFRMIVVASITNQQVREFWFFEFEKYSARFRSEAISPILNKIGQFLTSIPLRNIVGQKENTFDLRKVMDEGKILIVNLSKGKIGEDNSSLLGAMMIAKIQLAAMSRANIPEEKRKPFYLYVDEFHNFLTLSFADILSESRKYGLSLVLAHQYIEQLDEKIRAAVFGNVGTLISFRVGAEDAKYLSRDFYPVFDQTDLVNLSNHHIYLKLMIDGVTSKPFSATSLPPPERRASHKKELIKLSRKRYGKKRMEVEKEIIFKGDIKTESKTTQGSLFT
jgi:type IV secretory pathway TraG/TraD family ATPase VirD4